MSRPLYNVTVSYVALDGEKRSAQVFFSDRAAVLECIGKLLDEHDEIAVRNIGDVFSDNGKDGAEFLREILD